MVTRCAPLGSVCPQPAETPMQSVDENRLLRFFSRERLFAFTCDIDWAPEWAIAETLAAFEEMGVPLTVFLTHPSAAIRYAYRVPGKTGHVGLHPNFLPGSTQGDTMQEQIAYCRALWPEARFFRAHCFCDSALITEAFAREGFLFDSNICLFLQNYLQPLQHVSGLIRFPVFWEDDIHCSKNLPLALDAVRAGLDTPGLKVFNLHPLNFALNVPDQDYYLRHKFLYRQNGVQEGKAYAYTGYGERDLIFEIVAHLKRTQSACHYLAELFAMLPALG